MCGGCGGCGGCIQLNEIRPHPLCNAPRFPGLFAVLAHVIDQRRFSMVAFSQDGKDGLFDACFHGKRFVQPCLNGVGGQIFKDHLLWGSAVVAAPAAAAAAALIVGQCLHNPLRRCKRQDDGFGCGEGKSCQGVGGDGGRRLLEYFSCGAVHGDVNGRGWEIRVGEIDIEMFVLFGGHRRENCFVGYF